MALELDGVVDSITADTVVTAPLFAFSGWFWSDVSEAAIIFFMSDGSFDRYGCDIRVDSTIRFFATGTATGIAVSSASYSINTWHHVFGVTYSASSRSIWLDGGGEGTNATAVTTPTPTDIEYGGNIEAGGGLDGRLAELAIWAGSGVSAMGAGDAAILAAGYSPLALTNRLDSLESYYPLVRDLNWKSIGPTLSVIGSPTAIEHPRIVYPGNEDNALRSPGPFGNRLTPQGIIPFGLNYER